MYTSFINCMETVIQMSLAGATCMLTYGIRKGSAIDVADLDAVNDIFAEWITAELAPLLVDDLLFQSIKSTNLLTDSSPVSVLSTGFPATGSIVGTPVPNNVALVMSMATANRGRSYRGRNYIPALPNTGLQTASTWQNAQLVAFNAAYAELAIMLGADGYEHVILSRIQNGVQLAVGVSTRVDAYIARAAVGTQRRRVIGVGI